MTQNANTKRTSRWIHRLAVSIKDFFTLEYLIKKHKSEIRRLEQLKRNEIDAASGYKPTPLKDDEPLEIFMSTEELRRRDDILKTQLQISERDNYDEEKEAESLSHFYAAADYRDLQKKETLKVANVKLTQVMMSFTLIVVAFLFIEILWPSLGSNIKIEFYSTVAQIIPVLLIACFISPTNKEEDVPWKSFWKFAQNKSTGTLAALFGEIVCLTVLATGHSSTFTLLLSYFSLTLLFYVTLLHIIGARGKRFM